MKVVNSMKEKKKTPSKLGARLRKKFLSKRKDTVDCAESSTSDSESVVSQPTMVRVSTLMSGLAAQDSPVAVHYEKELPQEDDDGLLLMKDESTLSLASGTTEKSIGMSSTEPDIYDQVHPHETPELIATQLVAFDQAVTKMPDHKKKALLQAMNKCPNLLDDGFKLKFLRCEVFKEKLAAKRYCKYWDKRLEVFGPDRAFLPLTQDGALKDDLFALSIGWITLTGTKDYAGRNIIYGNPEKQKLGAYTSMSMVRALWYIFHQALEDEETQKRGIIFLADLRPVKLSLFDHELVRVFALCVQGCIPVRISGIHGCCPPRVFNVLFPVIKLLLGERLRKRVRLHAGPMHKAQKELDKYALTKAVIPDEIGGDVVLDHEGWLAQRRKTYG